MTDKCGGVLPGEERDVMNYATPQGPKHQMNIGPGLRGGENLGNCGTQGRYSTPARESGRVGLGGDNRGNSGSQGRR